MSQGGLLSPLLSNIYITSYDTWLEKRGHRFVRYADDCYILTKSKCIISVMDLTSFLKELGADDQTVSVVIDHLSDDYQELFYLFHSDYSLFLKRVRDDSAELLSFCLRYAYDLRAEYDKRNIPREIFTDTMQDIILWSDEYRMRHGVPGLDEASASWLRRHLLLRLFRLGSLQFEEPELPLYGFWEGVELPSCDRILKVHIPASADISVKAAEESFRNALSFYSADKILFICSSWLLSPDIKPMLGDESRILEFSSLFTISGTIDDRQAEERIFGERLSDPSLYPERTSLQKRAKRHLLSGGEILSGFGYLVRPGSFCH